MALRGVAYEDGRPAAYRTDEDGLRRKDTQASENWVWDPIGLAWVRMTQPGGAGGGGGGPATIADGADVAQGAVADVAWSGAGSGTLVAISKAEYAKIEAVRALLAGTLSVNVGLTDAQLRATPVPVSGPITDAQIRATPLPVSGPLTDAQLRASAVPVSGAFFQATQPVSLAANTPDVTDRAGRLLGVVDTEFTVDTHSDVLNPVSSPGAAGYLYLRDAGSGVWVRARGTANRGQLSDTAPTTLMVTATAATGVAATATLPAVAAQFHYITMIEYELYATAARTGAAAPPSITTTNLPGSPSWWVDTAQAIGTVVRKQLSFPNPLKSSVVNTATTIVCPVATTGQWRINVYYYAAP